MKNKKRVIFVIAFLILFTIYSFITIRGEYLEILGIGQEYVEIFKQNIKQKVTVFASVFSFIYITTYLTTIFVKKGLKVFFAEDKKEMPKLPNKSISLAFGIVLGLIFSNIIAEKAILAFNSALFGLGDPIFGIDIGYFVFQKPFIETTLYYLIGYIIILTIYIAAYYIIVFNRNFEAGISLETLKKNTFLKHFIFNMFIVVLIVASIVIINVHDTVRGNFLSISDGTQLCGAGLTDVTVKLWGYRLFALVIVVSSIGAIIAVKKGKFRQILGWLAVIPIYLIILFVIIVAFDGLYVKTNELDKEKYYIEKNISYTKKAYNIEVDENLINSSGAITLEDINSNQEIINNINIYKNEEIMAELEKYQTNSGYYSYDTTQIGIYNIQGQDQLVYVSPREIVTNDTRTSNSKTYEYTHGYGTVITSATSADENGNLKYLQNSFIQTDEGIYTEEPRIYFGMKTDKPIVTNVENKQEYDYPLTSTTNEYNTYNGNAGLNLGFFDRLILSINQKDISLAFSTDINKNSKIIANRNILDRVKTIMPYFTYDENPYLVITDAGRQVWVIDAYTMSSEYPYSQETTITFDDGTSKKINYIRNSVKVLVDAYNGTVEFYITDRTDPIAMAYWKMYPTLFKSLDAQIPEEIQKHFVYPKFLFDVQSCVIQKYHGVQPDVLYRRDDVWEKATENTTKVSTLTGTEIDSYYTMVKTIDSEKPELSIVSPYTIKDRQNLVSYLVGTTSGNGNNKLGLYRFNNDTAILGTIQLDTLISEDENISKELQSLNVSGTTLQKHIIVVPINNTLLYIEPIYQVLLNETQVPVLKKIIVASGNKVAIGNNTKEAILNLLSQDAINIEIESENIDDIVLQIINANKNLNESNASGNWEMIGKDIEKLQDLIEQLETIVELEEQVQ